MSIIVIIWIIVIICNYFIYDVFKPALSKVAARRATQAAQAAGAPRGAGENVHPAASSCSRLAGPGSDQPNADELTYHTGQLFPMPGGDPFLAASLWLWRQCNWEAKPQESRQLACNACPSN